MNTREWRKRWDQIQEWARRTSQRLRIDGGGREFRTFETRKGTQVLTVDVSPCPWREGEFITTIIEDMPT